MRLAKLGEAMLQIPRPCRHRAPPVFPTGCQVARLINHLLCASQGWGFGGEMSEQPFSRTHCVLVIEGAGGKSACTRSRSTYCVLCTWGDSSTGLPNARGRAIICSIVWNEELRLRTSKGADHPARMQGRGVGSGRLGLPWAPPAACVSLL